MLYNKEEHSRYVRIAGKVSIAAAVVGFAVFLVAFLVDVGSQELHRVSAQTASTSLTVLNTPPTWVLNAYEVLDNATSSPTNTGDVMQWQAIGEDSNNAPYFLLICSDNASPTADYLDIGDGTGIGEPICDVPSQGGTAIQWGVSASTASGALATVSTTTASTAISQFSEANTWYAWVCDDDAVNPRCSNVSTQGPTSTVASTSPFHVNNRPNFINAYNDGPVDPAGLLVFYSTSSDPDTVGGADDILIVVCQNAVDYNPATNDCDANFIASTTISLTSDATATYTVANIMRDDTYPANVFLVDEHGHEATDTPIAANFVVNNVAPTVLGGDIELQAASTTLILDVPGGETTGFTLDFTLRDANSCVNASSESEFSGYQVALFRDDLNSTSTCDGETAGHYDPNNCYTTGVSTTTVWNLDCTASTTQCTGPTVDQLDFTCTFPLWFVADPTDNGPETPAAFEADIWSVGVAGIDDNGATSSMATTSNPKDLVSFTALDLATAEIPYGALEPGDDTGTLSASTTVLSVGNTGLDQEILGDSMCGTYTATTTKCAPSATSTIPESEQRFSSSSLAYTSPGALALSSTTWQEVELDVEKTTATTTPNQGVTWWGIAVPASITLAGDYDGLNSFMGIVAEDVDWTP